MGKKGVCSMKKEYTVLGNIPLVVEGEHNEKEIDNIITGLQEKLGDDIKNLISVLAVAGEENFDVKFELRQPKFERIRRITGYLVGTTDRWNNAKQAEEHERVKHF